MGKGGGEDEFVWNWVGSGSIWINNHGKRGLI